MISDEAVNIVTVDGLDHLVGELPHGVGNRRTLGIGELPITAPGAPRHATDKLKTEPSFLMTDTPVV